ncbi:MAG: ATP-dependent helicase, partial [Actinomycetota bacterium]|nr:ATP-dependent helicase [Actinomycetota bacterium]
MFDTALWLKDLNDQQRKAATWGEGPLLIVAGAGSGKTKTLACRVACLLDRGVPPERVMLLTFTRRAARELLTRAGKTGGGKGATRVWGGTFHSVANRLLRMHGKAVGLPPSFTVMDESDSADLMNLVRSELELDRSKNRFPRKETLVSIYSRVVNSQTRLEEVLNAHFPWCKDDIDGIADVFTGYNARKRAHHVLDFDDLLVYWLALMSSPAARPVQDLFEYVLVDEYQDTNDIQARILVGLTAQRPNITVVGDDAQAIYSFRSATVDNILKFPEQFPGAEIVTLSRNYRSSRQILDASNAVIAKARKRYPKDMWCETDGLAPRLITCRDEAEQSELVCEDVLERREQGMRLVDQAVLFRAAHHSAALEVELSKRNIPYVKYGGLRFVEAAHVKDVLSFLRVLENPRDELSWFRLLQLIEGVGPKTAHKMIGALELGYEAPAGSPIERLPEVAERIAPTGVRSAITDLHAAAVDCRSLVPPAQIERVRPFFEDAFQRMYDAPFARVRDLDQLAGMATRYKTRSGFIADLTLDPPNSTADLAGPPDL